MNIPTLLNNPPEHWFCDCKNSEIEHVGPNKPHVAMRDVSGWFCMGCLAEFVRAESPPRTRPLSLPDKPGWWWKWSDDALPPRWVPRIVHPNLIETAGIWLPATPPPPIQ